MGYDFKLRIAVPSVEKTDADDKKELTVSGFQRNAYFNGEYDKSGMGWDKVLKGSRRYRKDGLCS